MRVFFLYQRILQLSRYQLTEYESILFWHYLPRASADPTWLRAQSQRPLPRQTHSGKSQIVTCTSDKLVINQRFLQPFLLQSFAAKWPIKLRKALYLYYQFIIKDGLKDTNEHPEEEVLGMRSGKVPITGASILWCWHTSASCHMDVHINAKALPDWLFRLF